MSDETAQALVRELAQIKVELGALRRAVATAGKLAGLPQWVSMVLLAIALLILMYASFVTAGMR